MKTEEVEALMAKTPFDPLAQLHLITVQMQYVGAVKALWESMQATFGDLSPSATAAVRQHALALLHYLAQVEGIAATQNVIPIVAVPAARRANAKRQRKGTSPDKGAA